MALCRPREQNRYLGKEQKTPCLDLVFLPALSENRKPPVAIACWHMLAVFAEHKIRLRTLLPKRRSDFLVCSRKWPCGGLMSINS